MKNEIKYEVPKSEPIIERQSSVVNTIHYTDKIDNSVYGFDSEQDAKELYKNFGNLVPMSDELFQQYKNRPDGGEWTVAGWVINKELESSEKAEKERLKLEAIKSEISLKLDKANNQISLLQDAIELDMAEDGDEQRLKEWKKYRIKLSRVNINNPVYPEKPQA